LGVNVAQNSVFNLKMQKLDEANVVIGFSISAAALKTVRKDRKVFGVSSGL